MDHVKFAIVREYNTDSADCGTHEMSEVFDDKSIITLEDAGMEEYMWLYNPVNARDASLEGFYREQIGNCIDNVKKSAIEGLDDMKKNLHFDAKFIQKEPICRHMTLFDCVHRPSKAIYGIGQLEKLLRIDMDIALCGVCVR